VTAVSGFIAAAGQEIENRARSIAEEPRVRLRGAAWFTDLDGDMRVGEAFPGTISRIDLRDTLRLDTDQVAAIGQLGFDLGEDQRWHIDIGYAGRFDYDGTSDPVSISFNDRVFTGVVESEARLDIYTLSVGYDVARGDALTLSLGGAARLIDFKGSVTGTATDPATGATGVMTESADALAPLPGVGAALRWDITDRLFARGVAQGIYLGNYGNYFDAAAEAGFDFTPNIGVFGGYRWLHVEADVQDVDFEANLKGFYAGVEVRF
jgi:hypothetical protein